MAIIRARQLSSPGFKANPYPIYARLRAEAPVHRTREWFRWVALVTRYEDVVQTLKDDRLSKDWKGLMPSPLLRLLRPIARNMLSLDPPDHTRLRSLVNKAFTPRLVERLRGRICELCDESLTAAAGCTEVDLVRSYALPLPLTVITDMLGVPPQDRRRFYSWTRSLIAGFFSPRVVLMLPDMWMFTRYLRKLFSQRRAQPRDDLLTSLLQAEEAGDRLTQDELVAMVIMLLIAGYETTVHLIAGGALALVQHPEQCRMLAENPALAEPAVEELLRYTSPLDLSTPRLAREDIALGSFAIRRGDLVLAAIGSANHDETQFPEPEKLDITRSPNRHLAFGLGAHFCLGAPLARLEAQIALPALLNRFPELRLARPAESLRWRKHIFLRALEELPVVLGRDTGRPAE